MDSMCDLGFIDANELEAAMCALGFKPTKVEVHNLIENADADGDGKIDIDEFIEMMTGKMVCVRE
jgi:Ca2+-binding EF-hand superfamily protein